MFLFRPGTNDKLIYEGIYQHNEYRLPSSLNASDLVIDIGAHVGFFSALALERGAGTIYAVEALEANYQLAVQHLAEGVRQGRVDLRRGAVWRSDEDTPIVHHSGFKKGFNHPHPGIDTNTGAGNVLFCDEGEDVPTIPFDDLLMEATHQGTRRVTWLKIDCEGSEWPILLTAQTLALVDTIVGEYHEIGGPYDTFDPTRLRLPYSALTVDVLGQFLAAQSFRFTHQRATQEDGSPARRGLFFAENLGISPCA